MKDRDVKKMVRKAYARAATGCCGNNTSQSAKENRAKSMSCCQTSAEDTCKGLDYSDEDLSGIPEGSNLGLGCGNPVGVASVREGETVLDLGSGAGIDCFLAARKVGASGKVIGVDMTPEMIDKATENAQKNGYDNVEFRLGEIENLPAGDNSVDVIISNCVINLSPDKRRVFDEAFRVLKPGGRMIISDIVLLKELPEAVRNSETLWTGCVSGALLKDQYIKLINQAGFINVKVQEKTQYPVEAVTEDPEALKALAKQNVSLDDVKTLIKSTESIVVTGAKPA